MPHGDHSIRTCSKDTYDNSFPEGSRIYGGKGSNCHRYLNRNGAERMPPEDPSTRTYISLGALKTQLRR